MNIPDEAVEIAARAAWEQENWAPWDEAKPDDLRVYFDDARLTLEAAAPYLMAQAWDEGKGIGQSGGWNKPNPYREAGDGE